MDQKVSNSVIKAEEDKSQMEDGLYLFTTRTCPNCHAAKEYLKNTTFAIVDSEENADLVREYGIMQAPTLVEIREGIAKKHVNASNIKRFAEEQLSCVQ
jgi:ribonucleoside-triphosphate reductase